MKITSLIKKSSFTGLLFLSFLPGLSAQNMQDGIKDIDYGLNDRARTIFKSIVKSDAKNAKAFYYLGLSYYEAEQNDSAKYYFNQGIAANAAEPLNYVGLGRAAMDDGKKADARANFDKAMSLTTPKDINVMVAIAEANISENTKDAAFAMQMAQNAQKANANDMKVLLALGDAYVENGVDGGGNAVTQYESARDKNPKNPLPYYKLGKIYIRARAEDVAVTNFKSAIEMDKDFALAYRELGSLYLRQNKFTDASEYLKKYLDLNGNNVSARTSYMSLEFLKKNYTDVINDINAIRKQDTSNVAVLRLLGYSYFETKDFKKANQAMAIFFARLGTKKPLASDYEYYAKSLDSLKNDSLAIYNYKKVVETDTTRTDMYSVIAEKYYGKKRYKDAIAMFVLRIKGAKDNSRIQDRYELAKSYYYTQQYELADSQFAKVSRAIPKNANVYLWRARTNASLDADSKKGLAKPYYEQFLEKANNDLTNYKDEIIESYSYLAYYYYVTKEYTQSREYCRKVIALDPKNSKILQLLKYYSDLDKKNSTPKPH